MNKLLLIAAAALYAMFGSTASADTLRADWMAGKRGMMVHWLFGEPGRIDYYVNAFDINKFMADFDATKSDYLIFTVGQNAGVYASPNAKITEYAGAGHCPTRDLVGEIAAAVHARGKKFIAYLPCELNANTTLHEGFGWPAAGSGKNMSTFQSRWLEVITEWATRWGSNLDGWWIDGYTNQGGHWPDAMSGADEALWAAALRAGNSNAVITFNPGLAAKTPRAGTVLSDYLAGEINSPSALNGWTLKEFADDATCRTHFLMPIDGFWGGYWSWDLAGGANPYSGRGLPNQQTMDRLSYVGQFPDPVVSESELSAMISGVFAVHGAVTINIGVNASGTLNPASVALLAKMPGGSESASAPRGTTVESLIGSWSSTPMASDGSTFSKDGDLVYAYSTASADKTVNGITFTGLGSSPASASSDFEFSPAFNTTQNAESDGMSGDLETIARLAWKNSEKTTKGYATMTFKGLTAGKRYCIQLYIHDTYCHNAAVFGPDAKSTVIYRSEENDPKSGKNWTCGGVFTGIITAKGTTHALTLNYPSTDRIELNALQVRCLGDAGDEPEQPVVSDPDTSWMKGSFGVSFHWTAKIVDNYGSKNWEQAVNDFDVEKFADSVESFGAKHVIFTVAHAWQQLPCPCAALDSYIAGRTTTRDLMKDIIDELTNRNIRVVFYYNHSCNHNEDSAWQAASGYNDITDESSMAAFGSKICSIVRELSQRYGDGVSAWWFDSATSVDDSKPWPNNKSANYVAGLSFPWNDLFAAARAGNPHAAVAVNWDVGATDQHELATDYLSGETEKIDAYGNFFPFAPGELQDHIWTRMDSSDWFWQGGEVKDYGSRFSAEQLAWWKVSHRDAGRMATLNLVIDESGNINPVVAQQLVNAKTIGKVWVQGRYDPTTWQAAPAATNLAIAATGSHVGDRSQYTDGYHRTPMTVLTDGAVPMTELVAGANLSSDDKAMIFESLEGNVFTWTLAQASDIYGLNIYSRSTRSGNNAQTDGGNDAIVVTKVEVRASGLSDWTDINAPALSFGKSDGLSGGALAAKLVDGTGAPLATGVSAIRFTQGAPENNASLLVECEIIGCAAGEAPDDPPPEEPEADDPEDIANPTKALVNHFTFNLASKRYYDCIAKRDAVMVTERGVETSDVDTSVPDGVTGYDKAIAIPMSYGLKVEHSIPTNGPSSYCMVLKFYSPAASDVLWRSFYRTVDNNNDAALFVKNNNTIGGTGAWGGYGTSTVTSGAWHTLIVSVDAEAGTRTAYYDGVLELHSGELSGKQEDLTARPYIYISVDDSDEDHALYFDDIRIYNAAKPLAVFDGDKVRAGGPDDTIGAEPEPPEDSEQPEDPVDPQPGELVNGRANMKGWAMKRISTASKVASEAGFGWTAADNPSSKSYSASESVMVFNEAQVVNTIQLFAPSSDMANMLAAFKVYGSDDGSSWSELLSVADEADWFARECRYYTFRNETAYSHYKLSVVSTVSGNAAKLGVYNYYFAKPADPTTPWTYASGKLTRGDQQFTNVAKDANKVYLQYSDNCSNESLYDLDFTAGIVDGSGNPIDLPFVVKGFNSNKGITRLVAPKGGLIFAGNTYTLQDIWYLNEVDFGTALSDAGKGTFKQCYSLQYLNETDWNIPILQEETFSSCYNLCGDLVFPVLTNKAAMASSLIVSVSFPNLEYFGNGNSYFGCFDRCASLRKIVLGPNLKKVNGGKAFGRLKSSEGSNGCDIYWKSASPEFTLPNGLFHEADKNVYTNYLPLAYKEEWTAFANNPGVSNCTLVLPETDDGVGTWTSGTQQVVKWWSEEPPESNDGFMMIVW